MEYVPRLVIVVTCIGGSACWQCAARGVVWQAWTCCLTGENERAQSSGDLKDKERKIRRWIVGAKLSSCILLRIVHEHAKSRQPSHTSLKKQNTKLHYEANRRRTISSYWTTKLLRVAGKRFTAKRTWISTGGDKEICSFIGNVSTSYGRQQSYDNGRKIL
jgi:hypothetical protein